MLYNYLYIVLQKKFKATLKLRQFPKIFLKKKKKAIQRRTVSRFINFQHVLASKSIMLQSPLPLCNTCLKHSCSLHMVKKPF